MDWRTMIKLWLALCSWIGIVSAYPHSVRRHEDYHYPYGHYDPYGGGSGYHVQYDPYTGEHIPNYNHHEPVFETRESYHPPPSPAPYGNVHSDDSWNENYHQYDHQNEEYSNQDYQEMIPEYSGRRYSMHVHPNKIFVEGHHNGNDNHDTDRDTIYFAQHKEGDKHKHRKEVKQGYGHSEKIAGEHKNVYEAYEKSNDAYKQENKKKLEEKSKPIKSHAKPEIPAKKKPEKITQKEKLVTVIPEKKPQNNYDDGKNEKYEYDISMVKPHKSKELQMEKSEHKVKFVEPIEKYATPEKTHKKDEHKDGKIPVVKSHEKKTPVKVTPAMKDDNYETKIDKRTLGNDIEDDDDYYDAYEEPETKVSREHEEIEEFEYPDVVESAIVNENGDDYETPIAVQTLSVKKKSQYKDEEYDTPTVVKVLTKKEKHNPKDEYEKPQVVKVLTKKPKEHSSNIKVKTNNHKESKDTNKVVKTEDYKSVISKINEEEFYLDETNNGRASNNKNHGIPVKNEKNKTSKVTTTTKKPKHTTTLKPKLTTTIKPKPNPEIVKVEKDVYDAYDQSKDKVVAKLKDSLLVTKKTVDGYNIPIVEAMALEEHDHDNDDDNQERLFPPFTNSNTSPEVDAGVKDEEIDDFEGSGMDENERSGGKSPRTFFPEDSSVWSVLTGIQSQERSKFKKCTTPRNETGNCMPIQLCPMTNIASTVDDLLKNVCVIDDVFIGVCCPEFPVERIQVDWGEFTHANEDVSEGNTLSDTDCGKRTDKATDKDAWPWMTSLISSSSEKVFCSGVLIKEQYVLTAAHCTSRIPRNQIVVRLKHADMIDAKTQDFAVVEIKRHANYNSRTMQNDIAILKLSKKVKLGKFRQVICLPEESEDYEGKNTSLLRWHSKNTTGYSEVLPVIGKEECQRRTGTFISDLMICAEPRTEEASCNADSGAPLVAESEDQYKVIGVLTWNRKDCDERFPSVFTRISSYTGWIKNHAA